MQLTKFAAAAALVAPALSSAVNLAKRMEYDVLGKARVHNRCPYTVYLWSVFRGIGCEQGVMETLEPGQSYEETYTYDKSDRGVSIKISNSTQCKGDRIDITQLEYFINPDPGFPFNFLDCSFVDCTHNSCPGRDKFFLKSGNNGDVKLQTAGDDKKICPVDHCNSIEECSKIAYVLPHDVQARSCPPEADLDFYICADSDAPWTGESSSAAPVPSKSKPAPKPEPTETEQEDSYNVQVANVQPEVTPAPVPEPKKQVHTKVVTVTEIAYEYTYAKRHEHAHRHAHRNAHKRA